MRFSFFLLAVFLLAGCEDLNNTTAPTKTTTATETLQPTNLPVASQEPPTPAPVGITFPDPVLDIFIRDKINKATGTIYQSDAESILMLEAIGQSPYLDTIKNLAGIEYLTNMIVLYLASQQISDITLLTNLTSLQYLDLTRNNISDISALANLTSLQYLILDQNPLNAEASTIIATLEANGTIVIINSAPVPTLTPPAP